MFSRNYSSRKHFEGTKFKNCSSLTLFLGENQDIWKRSRNQKRGFFQDTLENWPRRPGRWASKHCTSLGCEELRHLIWRWGREWDCPRFQIQTILSRTFQWFVDVERASRSAWSDVVWDSYTRSRLMLTFISWYIWSSERYHVPFLLLVFSSSLLKVASLIKAERVKCKVKGQKLNEEDAQKQQKFKDFEGC